MANISEGGRNCSACTRASENKHFDCPPRMADGRLFTDYRPRCDINYNLEGQTQKVFGMNSYAYRQYLINNAQQVMNSQRASTYSAAVCGPCVEPYDQGTAAPEQSVVKCDAQTCVMSTVDPRGIGVGRDYGRTADADAARSEFMGSKQQESATLQQNGNCCATAGDRVQYFGYSTPSELSSVFQAVDGGIYARPAVPSGATPLTGGDAVF
jgi:hypothetical protein